MAILPAVESAAPDKALSRIRLSVLNLVCGQLPQDEADRLLRLAASNRLLFVNELLVLQAEGRISLPKAHVRVLAADLERPVPLRSVAAVG